MDAGDDRANRRQLDVIVSMIAGLVLRPERVLAMRAMLGEGLDDPVRIGGQRPEYAGPALALLRHPPRGAVGFAPLRGRYRGIAGVLGGPSLPSSSVMRRVNSAICAAWASASAINSSLDRFASSS